MTVAFEVVSLSLTERGRCQGRANAPSVSFPEVTAPAPLGLMGEVQHSASLISSRTEV